ncbi:NADP-dependent malic enzyme [Catellatospora chokoriensis]|uniref:NADP-dependent malic enzyme n=1 Tax=Catellatospora chokoriensis TaxID=310353 RepID=UPI001786F935|nr:NADP-dependent malic enzyme [Catellatospora chokoriensis]
MGETELRGADEDSVQANRVAVVTGTALSPERADLPTARRRADTQAGALARLAGIDAEPVSVDTDNVEAFVTAVTSLAPGFAALSLEGHNAAECFEAQRLLQQRLGMPVVQGDALGLAVAVLAGLNNAVRVAGKDLPTARVVIAGVSPGAAATARLLVAAGVDDVVICGRGGALHPDDAAVLPPYLTRLIGWTNPRRVRGRLPDLLVGADALIDLAPTTALTAPMVTAMRPSPVVFALTDGQPVLSEVAEAAAVVVTRQGPGAVDAALALPGLLRGALNACSSEVSLPMQLAAADALSGLAVHVSTSRLLPEVGDERVVASVAAAVTATATYERRAAAPARHAFPQEGTRR